MSVSKSRLEEFAKYMEANKDVIEEVQERVNRKLFNKFMKASYDERGVISDIIDTDGLFFKEVSIILSKTLEIDNN